MKFTHTCVHLFFKENHINQSTLQNQNILFYVHKSSKIHIDVFIILGGSKSKSTLPWEREA